MPSDRSDSTSHILTRGYFLRNNMSGVAKPPGLEHPNLRVQRITQTVSLLDEEGQKRVMMCVMQERRRMQAVADNISVYVCL